VDVVPTRELKSNDLQDPPSTGDHDRVEDEQDLAKDLQEAKKRYAPTVQEKDAIPLVVGDSRSILSFLTEPETVSYTHLRAHETVLDLVCRLLLEKKKNNPQHSTNTHRATTYL